MNTPVFALSGITYAYRNVAALQGLDLVIRPGERVALLGPNGSGKSTLLRLLDGLCFASAGQLDAFGVHLTEGRLSEEAFHLQFRRKVGLVFQSSDVQLFNPTVQDEIAFGPLQLGWPIARVHAAVAAMLNQFGLTGLKDRAPHRLSGGEKKRVALASVLVTDPEVLLLDEPTAALDPRSRETLIALLAPEAVRGRTVITATHELDVVADIADRAVVMDGGRIVRDGRVHEVLKDGALMQRTGLNRRRTAGV